MAYVNVHVVRHLKEELAWVIDKRLQVNSNNILFIYNCYSTKNLTNKASLNVKQYCMCCYVAMWPIVMYSKQCVWRRVFSIQLGACWPVIRYVILLFVFNSAWYGCLFLWGSNFCGFHRLLIHDNLWSFIYFMFKVYYLQHLVFRY